MGGVEECLSKQPSPHALAWGLQILKPLDIISSHLKMDNKKRLAYAIICFLHDQLRHGGLSSDAQESLEGTHRPPLAVGVEYPVSSFVPPLLPPTPAPLLPHLPFLHWCLEPPQGGCDRPAMDTGPVLVSQASLPSPEQVQD